MASQNLFKQLSSQNNIWDAQLVGKNQLCKFPSDKSIFESYFNFCVKICHLPIEIETRQFFLKEAELALSIFCEKAEINIAVLKFIENKRIDLVDASNSINQSIQELVATEKEAMTSKNQTNLINLIKLKSQFVECTSKNKFDELIIKMSELESSLDKDSFSDDQQLHYENLTKDYADIISHSMARIGKLNDTKYNREAVESFKKAFDLFKSDPTLYSNSDSKLYNLVSKYLFAYDAKKLFNETLVYYNHVYTFIFNKLDDNGKFNLTKISIDMTKL